jgi:GTP-binding protein YchF
MRLGIIGLPQSGKTTLFNALTRGNAPTGISAGKVEVHTAVVDVPDERVGRLSQLFAPKKTTYAKVTYADIAGLDGTQSKEGISGSLLNQLTQMDGLIHVVRAFDDENVPHQSGSVNPVRDLKTMDDEFILNDLISIERKLERLQEEKTKGGGREKNTIEREIVIFERLKQNLNNEIPLRDLDISKDEEKTISGFGLLSLKPVVVALNLSESQTAPVVSYEHKCSHVVPVYSKLEMEISQLSPEEASDFLAEFHIDEPSLNKMIRISYDLLGLESFFTGGQDEVRAWTIHRGALAPEAAGVIHTDMQKGFIRAEVVTFDDLIALGGFAEARVKGKLRLEGKDYIVKDGDVLTIRFNL